MNTLILTTRAEILKTKHTAAFWLTIGGAAFIPFINVLKCLLRPDYFLDKVNKDPWSIYIGFNWEIAAGFMLMIYIILMVSLLIQIETRNNTWKQVLTTPRSYATIFFSKLFIVHSMVAMCCLLFNVNIILSGYLISLINPGYHFAGSSLPLDVIFLTSIRMYASVLAIVSIQFALNLLFKNFIAALAIGLGLFIAGFMIRQWEYIYIYPYMYPILVYFPNPGHEDSMSNTAINLSFAWTLMVTLSSFVEFSLRKMKG